MRNKKVIGSIAWCPKGHDERADISIKHFDNIVSTLDTSEESVSQIIVDCNVQHPVLQKYLEEIKEHPLITVYRFDEEIGFSKSRNYLIEKYLEDISNQFLIFVDSDVIFNTPQWLEKSVAFHKENPVMCSFVLDAIPTETKVDNKPKYYGGFSDSLGGYKIHAWEIIKSPVHFVHTKVIELVGGYMTEEYTDIHILKEEYGDRIKRAGFISVSKGMHVQPEIEVSELHPLQFEPKENKERTLKRNYESDVFELRKQDIRTGILRPYLEFKIDKAPVNLELE